jgi:hypothetical protein
MACEIVVAFGSETTGTGSGVALERGGRTFTPARVLQVGAAGDRGWHAMALDASGAAT